MAEVRLRYETPSAFRTALKDRFGQIARADRRYSLDELQRQFAYDRVLARLFSSDDADQWVLKGAGRCWPGSPRPGTVRTSTCSSMPPAPPSTMRSSR